MKLSVSLLFTLASSALAGGVSHAGVNIPGCELGPKTCKQAVQYGAGKNGQMAHFTYADKLNIFRLPLGWTYAVNGVLSGPLDESYMKIYDELVGSCIAQGGKCIIDVHNYARFKGKIVGQSSGKNAPTNADLANLWQRLAERYKPYQMKNQPQLVFGIMNEPYKVNINEWATTTQVSVNAIRNVMGNNDNWILLAGNDYDVLAGFQQDSAPALSKIHNNDKGQTKDNLIYEVHQYYDNDGGKLSTCVPNLGAQYVSQYMKPLATYLKKHNRMALLGETGGGPTDGDCITDVCAVTSYMDSDPDAWLGWLGWGAGYFATFDYNLQESPYANGTDVPLVADCIAGKFNGGGSKKREVAWSA